MIAGSYKALDAPTVTSVMGRLTLNVLLSFAAFERDLVSERTRFRLARLHLHPHPRAHLPAEAEIAIAVMLFARLSRWRSAASKSC